jgi:phosphatidylserine/phosphatidylglycerophosphate/cardiolipin synthase-like enzyme
MASRLDTLIGDGVEAAVKAKHRYRLRRLGWARAFEADGDGYGNGDVDGIWARGDPPPRPGCGLELLIDGAQALPAMAAAMRQARRYIHVTGWHVAPHFEIVRDEYREVLGTLLADMAEAVDVRILVWAGAPVPVFHPTRREVREAVENLVRGTRIRCEPDPREHPFHCHHEKTIMIDGHTAFVGGIDLTDAAGDRFDSSAHEARRQLGWHDVAVKLNGPAVADVDAHFALRWSELTGERLTQAPAPEPAGDVTVQVVRTIAEGMYDRVPHGEFRILESYTRALRSARELIYIENQFLWAPEIVSILADKLAHPPTPEFRLVVVLPSKPNNGADDTRGQLGVLSDADPGNQRLLAATLRGLSAEREDPLYVHAKVAIVDDRWLTVGSANLNAHSLLNDTELNVVTDDPRLAREARIRLWAEHLEVSEDAIADEPAHVTIDERWRSIAFEQLKRRRSHAPPTHRLVALPGVSKRARRLLGPLEGLIDDG